MDRIDIPTFKDLIPQFLKRSNVFAIVGVSADPDQYGFRVYKNLKETGFKIYPVNAKEEKIQNDKCYASLKLLPEKPDVVCIVTFPKETKKIIQDCLKLEIDKVWIQPGSECEEAIEFCRRYYIKAVYGHCIIKEMINPKAEPKKEE